MKTLEILLWVASIYIPVVVIMLAWQRCTADGQHGLAAAISMLGAGGWFIIWYLLSKRL